MTRHFLSPIPVATLLLSILAGYFLDRYLPIYDFGSPYSVSAGVILISCAVALMLFSVSMHAKHKTTLMPGGIPSALMTKGLFAFSRNPIYVLDLVIAFGTALIYGSVSALAAPLLCFVVLNTLVIPFEEQNLRKLFGKDYEEYSKRVRRWI